MKSCFFWILVVVLAFFRAPGRQAFASDRLDVHGYLKTFGVAYDPAPYRNSAAAPRQEALWSSQSRARVNAHFDIFERAKLDFSYDFSLRVQDTELFESNMFFNFAEQSVYRVDDLDPFLWPENAAEADHAAVLRNIDRLFLTYSAPQFDLYVGRQAIAWGSAHAVNPTDILAPYLYNDIDTEDRLGVDAARLRIPAGTLGEIDAGYVAGKDFIWRKSALFVRSKLYAASTDFAVLLAAFRGNVLAGIDVTRALGGAGTWIEAAYVFVNGLTARTRSDERADYLRLSTGIDYNFAIGAYTFLEYHYNQAGGGSPEEYFDGLSGVPYREGAVYLLGRHYLVPGVSSQLTPLINVFAEALINLSDQSFLFAPSLQYNFAEDFYLSAGVYAGVGDAPDAVPASIYQGPSDLFAGSDAVVIPDLHSEFGWYPNVYFLSLRFYY